MSSEVSKLAQDLQKTTLSNGDRQQDVSDPNSLSIPRRSKALSFSAVDNCSISGGAVLRGEEQVTKTSQFGLDTTISGGAVLRGEEQVTKTSQFGLDTTEERSIESMAASLTLTQPAQQPNTDLSGRQFTWSSPSSSVSSASGGTSGAFFNKLTQQLNTAPQQQDEEVDYLKLILNARVYDVAIESPLQLAKNLSNTMKNKILLKREDMQPIFSFKCRGAFNRMCQLTPEERARGVVAVSAGNHAQGVALAAQRLNIEATIVMPTFAPEIKVQNVRRLGAKVVLTGNDFDDAKRECTRLATEKNYVFIPPFDDPYVIAGQGTVGVEILRQLKSDRLDAIFIGVGGGGLIAGVAAFVKRVRPDVKIIGVNTVDSTSMTTSLQRGERTEMSEVGLFSDGTSVRLIGKENFRLCQKYVDQMVLVTNDEICAAIKDTYEDTRSILEPAGALSLAGCKRYLRENPHLEDGVYAAVLSGANMNFDRLQFVAERARIGSGKEAILSVIVPEKPGSLTLLHDILYPRAITELSYRYSDGKDAHVFVAFEVLNGKQEIEELIKSLADKNMTAIDVSDDELTKSHGRFLAGGRSAAVVDESLYRFTFPERPGALQKFIHRFSNNQYNISLVHYRNRGADMARILLGVQVPVTKRDEFEKCIQELGYSYSNETENPVYKHFLH